MTRYGQTVSTPEVLDTVLQVEQGYRMPGTNRAGRHIPIRYQGSHSLSIR